MFYLYPIFLSQRDTFHQLPLALPLNHTPCNIPDALYLNDFVSEKNKYIGGFWTNPSTCRSTTTKDADPSTVTLESSVEQAKRAFALKKYEEAIDHYATALEFV